MQFHAITKTKADFVDMLDEYLEQFGHRIQVDVDRQFDFIERPSDMGNAGQMIFNDGMVRLGWRRDHEGYHVRGRIDLNQKENNDDTTVDGNNSGLKGRVGAMFSSCDGGPGGSNYDCDPLCNVEGVGTD